jgi:hypothetical protein
MLELQQIMWYNSDGSAQLPAVDGSQLTNLDAASPGFALAMAVAL